MSEKFDQGSERFEIIPAYGRQKYLGKGGFGTTFKVRVLDHRLVKKWGVDIAVIKVPNDRELELGLMKEAVSLGLLSSHLRGTPGGSHVVRYLDVERFKNKMVLVMEFAAGASLRDRIGRIGYQKPMPLFEVDEISRGVLLGLAAIHLAKVIHRDIKPENVIVGDTGPKILDLGLSAELAARSKAHSRCGTVGYMSPEVLFGSGAMLAADVWSTGVMMYEMITGIWPFGSAECALGEMAELVRSHHPLPPTAVRRQIAADRLAKGEPAQAVEDWSEQRLAVLDHIVLKALAKNPDERYVSAQAMLDDLEKMQVSHAEQRSPAAPSPAPVATVGPTAEALVALRDELNSPSSLDLSGLEGKIRGLDPSVADSQPEYFELLGQVLARQGRFTDAVAVYRAGLARWPSSAAIHLHLGLTLDKLGNNLQAKESFEAALQCGLKSEKQKVLVRSHINRLNKVKASR